MTHTLLCPLIMKLLTTTEMVRKELRIWVDPPFVFSLIFWIIFLDFLILSLYSFRVISCLLPWILFFWQRILNLVLPRSFCCPYMLTLKPRSWHACCHHLTLETMLRMTLQLEFCLMMRLWNEIDHLLNSNVDHQMLEPFVWS